MNIYSDGSVLGNTQTGARLFIPANKVVQSYYTGNKYYVFSAELVAIRMALHYILNLPVSIFRIGLC